MSPIISGGGGGGGSQTSLVDLGIVNASALVAGPQTLYTPPAGRFVLPFTGPDSFVRLQPQQDLVIVSIAGALPVTFDLIANPTMRVWAGQQPLDTTWSMTLQHRQKADYDSGMYGQPIKAVLTTDTNGFLVRSQPPAWQANHVYTADFLILGPDNHLWSASAGTSGGSIPDFAANEGSTVVDNTVTWTDEGAIPTQGTLHVYALVATT